MNSIHYIHIITVLFSGSISPKGMHTDIRTRPPTPADEYYYMPVNRSKTTINGIGAYRSALTLDWLAGEDSRQRELVAAFERQPESPYGIGPTECIAHPQPVAGKVARLMLELLKNLEGDDGQVIPDLIQALIRTKLLVLETSIFDVEPDFDALVKTPDVMLGEPHTNFPRILAMVWITVSDPSTKKFGWCAVNKVTKYLSASRPSDIAKNMRALDPMLARARFIMEEFIQHVTPINMLKSSSQPRTRPRMDAYTTHKQTRKYKTNKKHHQTENFEATQEYFSEESNVPSTETETMRTSTRNTPGIHYRKHQTKEMTTVEEEKLEPVREKENNAEQTVEDPNPATIQLLTVPPSTPSTPIVVFPIPSITPSSTTTTESPDDGLDEFGVPFIPGTSSGAVQIYTYMYVCGLFLDLFVLIY